MASFLYLIPCTTHTIWYITLSEMLVHWISCGVNELLESYNRKCIFQLHITYLRNSIFRTHIHGNFFLILSNASNLLSFFSTNCMFVFSILNVCKLTWHAYTSESSWIVQTGSVVMAWVWFAFVNISFASGACKTLGTVTGKTPWCVDADAVVFAWRTWNKIKHWKYKLLKRCKINEVIDEKRAQSTMYDRYILNTLWQCHYY